MEQNIRAQTIRLSELMKNLLTLARTDEDGTSLPMSEFSMDLLVQEALDVHRTPAQAKNLNINTDIQPSTTLKGNRDSIMQLVSVLLDNACKYTPDSGTVSLSLHTEGNNVRLQVKNTCTEPPEKDLDKLFDRFYRGDAARTQSTGGYGIGLSAARTIAQSHGGTVTADYDKDEQVISFTVRI